MAAKEQEPQGMATEGLPQGPDIKEHTQEGQPGIQAEMETKPEITKLPTQHGTDEVLKLEYVGVGKLKGKRAIVTGGDSGIGLSAAVMMAREGAKVAIVHHPSEATDVENARQMIEKEGVKVLTIGVDLSEGDDSVAKRIIDEVVNEWGRVDILVNNAASQRVVPSVTDTDPQILESTFKTNVYPMFYLAKYAVPHMPRGSSSINSTSVMQNSASTRRCRGVQTACQKRRVLPRGR